MSSCQRKASSFPVCMENQDLCTCLRQRSWQPDYWRHKQSGTTSVSECCWCQTQVGCSSPGRAPHACPTRCNRRWGGGGERNRLRREDGSLRGRKRRNTGRTKEAINQLRFCMRKASCHRSVPFAVNCQPTFPARPAPASALGHVRRDSRPKR